MKRLPVIAAAVLLATAGCGGDAEESGTTADPAPSSETTAAPTSAAEGSSGGEVLNGTIGEEGDPDAFVITLTDTAGEEITELPAGDYTIAVNDPSSIHNFRISGPGVDQATTVPEVTTISWDVTLEAGTYEIVCDPHPDMRVELTVT